MTTCMVYIDITVLPVALPTIQRDLQVSDLTLHWMINAYTLALAALLLAGGKLGRLLGLRTTFCLGITLFTLASALCGMGGSGEAIIAGRALQGIGGALLLPTTTPLIFSCFTMNKRGKATGLNKAIGAVFLCAGPLVGGFLTTYFGWRYVFWINLPIGVCGLLLALSTLPFFPKKKEPFDIPGFVLFSFGITSIVLLFMQTRVWGWISFPSFFFLVFSVTAFAWLYLRRHRPNATFINFSLILKRSFLIGTSTLFFTSFVGILIIFFAVYFQTVLGFSAIKAGGYIFIGNSPALISPTLAGHLIDRYGSRLPLLIGFSLIFVSLLWFSLVLNHANVGLLVPSLALWSFGMGMIPIAYTLFMLRNVGKHVSSSAIALISTYKQLSSTLGLALFGALYVFVYEQNIHFKLSGKTLISQDNLEGVLSRSQNATQYLDRLPPQEANDIVQAAKTASLHALEYLTLTGTLSVIIPLVIVYVFFKPKNGRA